MHWELTDQQENINTPKSKRIKVINKHFTNEVNKCKNDVGPCIGNEIKTNK